MSSFVSSSLAVPLTPGPGPAQNVDPRSPVSFGLAGSFTGSLQFEYSPLSTGDLWLPAGALLSAAGTRVLYAGHAERVRANLVSLSAGSPVAVAFHDTALDRAIYERSFVEESMPVLSSVGAGSPIDLPEGERALLVLEGTFDATVQMEYSLSLSGNDWYSVGLPLTAPGAVAVPFGSAARVRANTTVYTSGTPTLTASKGAIAETPEEIVSAALNTTDLIFIKSIANPNAVIQHANEHSDFIEMYRRAQDTPGYVYLTIDTINGLEYEVPPLPNGEEYNFSGMVFRAIRQNSPFGQPVLHFLDGTRFSESPNFHGTLAMKVVWHSVTGPIFTKTGDLEIMFNESFIDHEQSADAAFPAIQIDSGRMLFRCLGGRARLRQRGLVPFFGIANDSSADLRLSANGGVIEVDPDLVGGPGPAGNCKFEYFGGVGKGFNIDDQTTFLGVKSTDKRPRYTAPAEVLTSILISEVVDVVTLPDDGHVLSVQATVGGVRALGTITAVAASALAAGVDTDGFLLDDGTAAAVQFSFDDDGSVVETDTLRAINHTGAETAEEMRDAIVAAINAAPTLAITATPDGAVDVANLRNDVPGVAGNVATTETVVDAGFLVTGMASGAAGTPSLGAKAKVVAGVPGADEVLVSYDDGKATLTFAAADEVTEIAVEFAPLGGG